MGNTKLIDPTALLEEAKESEHRESYMLLDRNKNYRIGVGAEVAPSNQPSFFLEVLVYLCPESDKVDLQLLEKALMLLKELKKRGFMMCCQDCNCVCCQRIVTPDELVAEYEGIESMMKKVYK
ncbi:MAG: hypothetical protein WED04_06670 [Promethearchaeati archaeon SRVP18_Atabeyarchaeia-1]